MMVIGNKIDIQKDRAVSKEEGKALAEDFGAGFLEVSVSTSRMPRYFSINIIIQSMFTTMIGEGELQSERCLSNANQADIDKEA